MTETVQKHAKAVFIEIDGELYTWIHPSVVKACRLREYDENSQKLTENGILLELTPTVSKDKAR